MTVLQTPMRGPLPSSPQARAIRWLHERLFSTRGNTLLSLFLIAILAWLTWSFGRWLLLSADFEVIRVNRRLLLVGRFPLGEEWRIWPIFYGLVIAIGWTWGAWTHATRVAAATLILIAILVLPVIAGTAGTIDAAPGFAGGALAYFIARRWSRTRRGQRQTQVMAAVLWLVLLPSTIVLLQMVTSRKVV